MLQSGARVPSLHVFTILHLLQGSLASQPQVKAAALTFRQFKNLKIERKWLQRSGNKRLHEDFKTPSIYREFTNCGFCAWHMCIVQVCVCSCACY